MTPSYSFGDYADDLYKLAIGILHMSVADFFISEVREIILAIDGYNAKTEKEFALNQMAVSNAIGIWFGSKSFKPKNPFQVDKPKTGKISKDEKEETKQFLLDRFK